MAKGLTKKRTTKKRADLGPGSAFPHDVSVARMASFAVGIVFNIVIIAYLAQLEGYVHRYGPGMVVYWFGFAAALADPAASGDLDVVVAAEFPAEILFPAAEVATELPLRVRCS